MLIYSQDITARLNYVLNFIFRDFLEMEFSLTDKQDLFREAAGAKINYSRTSMPGAFQIFPEGLLAETGIRMIKPMVDWLSAETSLPDNKFDLPLLFKYRDSNGFDIFSAVFYMISRFEEYLDFTPDKYGRFESAQALGAQHGFLEIPVVDHWVLLLKDQLQGTFRDMQFTEHAFLFRPGIDIDLAFAYKYRPALRRWASRMACRLRGDRSSLAERKAVLSGIMKDPFDTIHEIAEIHQGRNPHPIFFFLAGKYGRYDRGIPTRTSGFKKSLDAAMAAGEIGCHPSWRSNRRVSILKKEKEGLEGLARQSITKSRQHYLMLSFPETYRRLIDVGIKDDYSMGFASAPGFRSGSSRPHLFYDLSAEKEYDLRIHPFQAMDRSLKDYLDMDTDQAFEKLCGLIDRIKMVNGIFSTIWHNDAFSDRGEWKGWKDLYIRMLDYLEK